MQYDGRIDFEYPKEKLENLARRSGEYGSLVDSGVFFWLNVTDWYSGMNRTGWAGTIITSSQVKLKWIGERIRTFKPRSTMKIQVMLGFVYVCVCVCVCGERYDMPIHECVCCCCGYCVLFCCWFFFFFRKAASIILLMILLLLKRLQRFGSLL